MYDVIIIGAGPAGLTAAIYTSRKNLKTLVVSVDVGGQINLTSHIENYPGVDPQSGFELTSKMKENAESFGAEFKIAKVDVVKKKNNFFEVTLGKEKLEAKGLIITSGKVQRMLDIPGEKEFLGKGVSTCATCDAPLYKNKTVAVIGGGNSAIEAVLELSNIAKKVYLVHRRDEFRADEISVKKISKLKNVEMCLSCKPLEVIGDNLVQGLKIKNNEERVLDVDGVFLEIGFEFDTEMFKGLVDRDKKGAIKINDKNETNMKGVTAAGDVTTSPYKQVVIAAGDGAKAALSLYNQLTGSNVKGDWT